MFSNIKIYKIYCNVIYTPMARSCANYFFNPFFIIYSFINNNDFNKKIFYFVINETIEVFKIFFGAVYNEFIIIYFCGLEYDTKISISQRALEKESVFSYNIKNDSFNAEHDDYIIRFDNEDNEDGQTTEMI